MVFPVFAIWFKRWVMIIGAQMGWAVAWAAAVVAALALAGCSTTGAARLAYNQAPELAYWLLDDYVDFSGAQSLQVKAALRGLHDWHRETQLPLYA